MDFKPVAVTNPTQNPGIFGERPLDQNDFHRMHGMLLGCDLMRACIRHELNSIIDNINNINGEEGMLREIYVSDALTRCQRNEILLGTHANKRQMSDNEKILFTTLFRNIAIAALQFHPEVDCKAQWVAGDPNKGEAFFVGRNTEGEVILMHQASVKETKEIMTLARITNPPLQLQARKVPDFVAQPQNPQLISELQQKIDPNFVQQQQAQPSLSQQYPQYHHQQLQNLQPKYHAYPTQPVQQPLYPDQSRNRSQSSPTQQQFNPSPSSQPSMVQQPQPSVEKQYQERFETRRNMIVELRSYIENELKLFLDRIYHIQSNQAGNTVANKNLNEEQKRAFNELFPRISGAFQKFYQQGTQDLVWVMGDQRPETNFFVERKGDRISLTKQGEELISLNYQPHVYTQPQNLPPQYQPQVANPSPSDQFNRQRANSSTPHQPSVNQQQFYAQQPAQQTPPTGYPPNYPTGY